MSIRHRVASSKTEYEIQGQLSIQNNMDTPIPGQTSGKKRERFIQDVRTSVQSDRHLLITQMKELYKKIKRKRNL